MDKLKVYLDLIGPEAIEVVKQIEAGPMTTRDHYGDYLAAISTVWDAHSATTAKVFAVAMLRAGGNQQGIKAALQILGVM